MIRADDVNAMPADSVQVNDVTVVDFDLAIEDQAYALMLDAELEEAAAVRRPGEMFEASFDRLRAAESGADLNTIMGVIKRAWESGGWVVGVFASESGYRAVFARPHRRMEVFTRSVVQEFATREGTVLNADGELEQVVIEMQAPAQQAHELSLSDDDVMVTPRTSTPLLVRMPTRARPGQALEVLRKYRDMAVSHVAIEVIIDADDSSCNNSQFLQALADIDARVTVGNHKSKIEACNAGRVNDWGVLVLASDDMVPMAHGYDQKILQAMERHFPLRDGAINFNDGYNKDHVRPGEHITNTLPVMGRWLWEENGRRVYWPEYKSIYCDTDASFVFNAQKRMAFVDEVIVEHRHFANDKARMDALYTHNAKFDDHDRLLFEARRARNFDLQPPVLSILICSISSRRQQLERLVDYLRWQVSTAETRGKVEICADCDDVVTVGAKRQRLLERACGTYVAFIDDDDWVSADYCQRVVAACAEGKDCVSLTGIYTENGMDPRTFEHSLKYKEWCTTVDHDGKDYYERYPNHLNGVRRELALQVGFVPKNVGEDHDYSTRLRPLLGSEASIGSAAAYFYWNVAAKSVQSGRAR